MVSNEIQVENNNNERNLDIYQSTSEIIQRNIMSSTEEIQALISQIYANIIKLFAISQHIRSQ